MKFFTTALYDAQYADEGDEIEAIRVATTAFNAHITGLGNRFPAELRPFADPYVVDDALLVSATSDRSKRELELVLRCGNIPNGYWDGVFHYYDVELSPADQNVLKQN